MRSEGGHRRYSRQQLRRAARARELVDQGTPIEAACRIVRLEDDLEEALRINEDCAARPSDPGAAAVAAAENLTPAKQIFAGKREDIRIPIPAVIFAVICCRGGRGIPC
jgi:DNA-binding transcriptional MerR regulator